MAVIRGKQFETVIKEAFQKVPGVSIDRIHDQMNGYVGSANVSDFIVYKEPYEYYIECKTTHGNTLPFSNITDNQWRGLLEKSKIPGVHAGVICWFISCDITIYYPIQTLETLKRLGRKSVKYNEVSLDCVILNGKKKRVFWEYDMISFFTEV